MAARLKRVFPRGWKDFVLQVAVWIGFVLAYQVARGVADRNPGAAFQNGLHVIAVELHLHALFEIHLERLVLDAGGYVLDAVNWTYWMSQFPVLGAGLLWIYFFRNEAFVGVRNWILATNVLALVGYVLLPTAPPRFFPGQGFVDTLLASSINHRSGFVELASNQYAAMPSVHSADALVIGVAMATLVRTRPLKLLWLLWPAWVWFSVMATGNHYWLDVAGGVAVALAARTALAWWESRRRMPETVPSSGRW